MNLAKKIVHKMMDGDAFSQWLGIEVMEISPGYCKLQMTIRDEMTNGFSIAHGGISYSLADSALAFAANSHGRHAVSVETSITHTKKVLSGTNLVATAKEVEKDEKTGIYTVCIENEKKETVANFKGKVYRMKNKWFSKT